MIGNAEYAPKRRAKKNKHEHHAGPDDSPAWPWEHHSTHLSSKAAHAEMTKLETSTPEYETKMEMIAGAFIVEWRPMG